MHANMTRRVVVTGLGLVTPLGSGVPHVWTRLLDKKCGLQKLKSTEDLDYSKVRCRIAGIVPRGTQPGEHNSEFDAGEDVERMNKQSISVSSEFALAASHEALSDARWFPRLQSKVDRERTGVSCGSVGMISPEDFNYISDLIKTKEYRKISPFFIPRLMVNMSASHISIRYGLQGPSHCVSTSCTTGLVSIGDASSMIARGAADVMMAGAGEDSAHPLIVGGFCQVKAMCTKFNDHPESASRPFDVRRCGFVPSEGAGMVVLEELEHAKSRNAHIYAEILGYGLTCDASHITAPCQDGSGAIRAIRGALSDAGLRPEDVSHVNAHSTSTPIGDAIENQVIKSVFGNHAYNLSVYAPKGALGHLMAASGSVETVIAILSINKGLIPPNLNLEETEPEFDLNYVTKTPAKWTTTNNRRKIAIKNAFGFGGINASLCIGEYCD